MELNLSLATGSGFDDSARIKKYVRLAAVLVPGSEGELNEKIRQRGGAVPYPIRDDVVRRNFERMINVVHAEARVISAFSRGATRIRELVDLHGGVTVGVRHNSATAKQKSQAHNSCEFHPRTSAHLTPRVSLHVQGHSPVSFAPVNHVFVVRISTRRGCVFLNMQHFAQVRTSRIYKWHMAMRLATGPN